jgi:hypothetical protein
MRFGELVKNLSSEARELDLESIARTCEAVDQVQLSRAGTRHAIEQSRSRTSSCASPTSAAESRRKVSDETELI